MTDEQNEKLMDLGFDLNQTDSAGEALSDKFDALDINIDDFKYDQLRHIINGLKDLTVDEVSSYANPDYSDQQMYIILTGLKDDTVPREVVELYAKPEIGEMNMGIILNGARDYNISFKDLELFTKPGLSDLQLSNALYILREGFDSESAAAVADPDLDSIESMSMRYGIENGLNPENLKEEIKDAESKLDSFVIGDTTINKISVWDVTQNFKVLDIDHFYNSDYFVYTDNGDFEVHVAINGKEEPSPFRISIFYKIESDNDDPNNGKYIQICCDINTQWSVAEIVGDTFESDSASDYVDVDKHSLKIEKFPVGDNKDDNAQFSYTYTIDGKEMIEDTQYDNDTFNSISRFLETNKDAVEVEGNRNDLFNSLDYFREEIEDRSDLLDFEAEYSSEHQDAADYLNDHMDEYADRFSDVEGDSVQELEDAYAQTLDEIEASGVLDKTEEDAAPDSTHDYIDFSDSFDFSDIIHESIIEFKEHVGNDSDDTDNNAQNDDIDLNNDTSLDESDEKDESDISDSDDDNYNDLDSFDAGFSDD